jgi:hypothetical protein
MTKILLVILTIIMGLSLNYFLKIPNNNIIDTKRYYG